MMMYRVRGAILIGIILTSIISWPRSTPVTYFPHSVTGDALFDYFKQVVAFHKLKHIGNVIDVSDGFYHNIIQFSKNLFLHSLNTGTNIGVIVFYNSLSSNDPLATAMSGMP